MHEVPVLYVKKSATSLLLDPVGYDVPGVEGVADLYLMPAYDPMASLYFEGGQWVLHYDAFPPDPREPRFVIESQDLSFSADTINQVLYSIAEHAVSSV